MVETALVLSLIVNLVLGVCLAACLALLPFFWLRISKLETNLEKLDETLAETLQAAGMGEVKQRGT